MLLLEGGLAFCGGSLGKVDKSQVTLMEEGLCPRCPTGETESERKALMRVLMQHEWRLVQVMLRKPRRVEVVKPCRVEVELAVVLARKLEEVEAVAVSALWPPTRHDGDGGDRRSTGHPKWWWSC